MAGRRKVTDSSTPTVAISIEPEPRWVDPVIAFANDDLRAPHAVRRWDNFVMSLSNADFRRWRKVEHVLEDQSRLRSLLTRLVSGGSRARINADIARSVHVFGVKGGGGFHNNGKFSAVLSLSVKSFEQWYALALAALIHAEIADRVCRCADNTCKKFFIDWPRRGPRRAYCCVQHQDRDFKRKHR